MDLNKTTMGSQQMLDNEIRNNQLEHAALMILLFGDVIWPKELRHLTSRRSRAADAEVCDKPSKID
ncbi:unnamed protein product [marine sediment metagenome]|uniref:Uncharacterized protein n=1 Tax=marine sediment metagenome TaxID=412755 RepID=X1BNU3_9ZZZZ